MRACVRTIQISSIIHSRYVYISVYIYPNVFKWFYLFFTSELSTLLLFLFVSIHLLIDMNDIGVCAINILARAVAAIATVVAAGGV